MWYSGQRSWYLYPSSGIKKRTQQSCNGFLCLLSHETENGAFDSCSVLKCKKALASQLVMFSQKAARFHETPANWPSLHSQRKVIQCHLLCGFSRQRWCLLSKIGVGWSAAQAFSMCLLISFFFFFKHICCDGLSAAWMLITDEHCKVLSKCYCWFVKLKT